MLCALGALVSLLPLAPRAPRALGNADTRMSASATTLRGLFEEAVVLQRASMPDKALEAYDSFLQAAHSCGLADTHVAEAYVNQGTIHARRGQRARARALFERALQQRSIGSAHLNLALILLAEHTEATRAGDTTTTLVPEAAEHCRRAVALRDDEFTFAKAQQVLLDIERSGHL